MRAELEAIVRLTIHNHTAKCQVINPEQLAQSLVTAICECLVLEAVMKIPEGMPSAESRRARTRDVCGND
jgi:hypothetical protein